MSGSNGNLLPNARARESKPKQKAKSKPKKSVKQLAFLAAYSETGNITQAAEIAKVCRTSHNDWLEKDETYGARFDEAHEAACDHLESEARRRAVEGIEDPVFQGGIQVGTVRRYSDKLLELLLKGSLPQKYKTMIQQETKESRTVTVNHRLDLRNLPLDDQLQYRTLLTKLLGTGGSRTRTG